MASRLQQLIHYWRLFQERDTDGFQLHILDDQTDLLTEAQRLHAAVYLSKAYIKQHEVDENGLIDEALDPYRYHSLYFCVTHRSGGRQKVVAAARQIMPHQGGHQSFPTFEKLNLDATGRQIIASFDPAQCVEISALVKLKGVSSYATLLLYRAMWQYSLLQGHKVWIMACDADFYPRLRMLFGETFTEIGPPEFYLGSMVVPAMLEVDRSLERLMARQRELNPVSARFKAELIRFLVRGLPPETLPVRHRHKLKRTGLLS